MTATTCALALAWAALGQANWYEPFPAHKVIGNVYYVGSKDLASYLITTPEGHMLINSGFEATVPLIRRSVESLGYKMADIKVLLASHVHSDHVAGHARMKELTGAKVYVMRGDDAVIASGGKGQYLYTQSRWKPCPVDRVLEDGDEVKQSVTRKPPGRWPHARQQEPRWLYDPIDHPLPQSLVKKLIAVRLDEIGQRSP